MQLGGHPIYTRGEEVGFDTREPVEDVARIMAGYHAVIAARVFDHATLTRMAAVVDVPVVNMLVGPVAPAAGARRRADDAAAARRPRRQDVAYVGDYNNVARSLAEICCMLGAHVRLACPRRVRRRRRRARTPRADRRAATVAQSHRPADAVAGAHAVHTDTWVSMGQEAEKTERRQQFEGYMVDATMMSGAADPARSSCTACPRIAASRCRPR